MKSAEEVRSKKRESEIEPESVCVRESVREREAERQKREKE